MTPSDKPQSMSDLLKLAQAAQGGKDSATEENKETEEKEAFVPPSVIETDDDDESIPEGPGFMSLYTTLMLLLMTFFIVLVSMGSPSAGEFEKGKKSLQASFSLMGLSGSKEAMFFVYSVLKIQNSLVKETLDNHLNKEQNMVDEPKSTVGDDIYWQDGLSKEEVTQLHRFVSLGFSIAASDPTKKYLRVTFPNEKIFQPRSAQFISTFHSSLRSFLNTIGTDFSQMAIRVYTIETPLKETGLKSPLELSALRAKVVSETICDIQDIDCSKIIAIGYGEYYAGLANVPESKQEIVELNIYNLWGNSVAKEVTEDAKSIDAAES
jgi:flagellar motor protein MotB